MDPAARAVLRQDGGRSAGTFGRMLVVFFIISSSFPPGASRVRAPLLRGDEQDESVIQAPSSNERLSSEVTMTTAAAFGEPMSL